MIAGIINLRIMVAPEDMILHGHPENPVQAYDH